LLKNPKNTISSRLRVNFRYLNASSERDCFPQDGRIFPEVLFRSLRVGEDVCEVVVGLVDADPRELSLAFDQITDDVLNVALDVKSGPIGDTDDNTVRSIFLEN